MLELPTGTVTFLFTDIEGSTTLWEQHPEAARQALVRHDALVEQVVAEHYGHLVRPRGEGDSRFAVFARATDAVAAAAALQQALDAEAWPAPTQLRVRMAIHTGEADLREGDYYGSAVNRCARLRAVAHGGQTLLSAVTYGVVRAQLPAGIELRDLGEHRLRDLIHSEHIYQLNAPGLPADFSPLATVEALPGDGSGARRIRGYELREQLGAGGYGVVYRAFQSLVNRDVAIKIILPQHAAQPDFIRRFEHEAQLVARLEHPHIVPLYDYWRDPTGAYLIMRWMRGGSLAALLHQGPLTLPAVLMIFDQIVPALGVAHHQGIVHRDLKPANILLDEQGNAYLADFGIAKELANTAPADETGDGALLGSPAYSTPEQIRNEPISPRSDIYSLGVLLYELLTGRHPFGATAPAELFVKHLQELLPTLEDARPDLPQGLDEVIARATAKDPGQRYPEASRLLADLHQVDGRTTAADPSTGHQARYGSSRLTPRLTPLIGADTAGAAETTIQNPYKGLRAFQEGDAADFFGRTALITELVARLAEQHTQCRFLAVVGPSGSGKSSVVRAGLIPALRRGALPGSERWFIVELFPGGYPLEELEAALLRVAINPPASLIEQLQHDERGLGRVIKRILPGDEAVEIVLVIDQFEELFTLVEDEGTRLRVLKSLAAAVADPRSRLRLIITLRADFYDRPLLYAGFGDLMRERTAVVLPLSAEDLAAAIVEPALRAGLRLETGLVATIVADVGEQPGALPLLQYALMELFERREGRILTLAAYHASGGVAGALARRADDLYAELDPADQEAARQLFLRLVTLGEGVEDTRRRVRRSELAGDQQIMERVIAIYSRYRLLTFDRDPITREPTVEVAHEALLRTWERLRAWLAASREELRVQRRLTTAAQEWLAAGEERSFLATGARLAQFAGLVSDTMLALNADEQAYIEASLREAAEREAAVRALQERELLLAQRTAAALRRRALLLAVAVVLAMGTAGVAALFARNNATLATQNAAIAVTAQASLGRSEQLRLAAEAENALTRGESGNLPALLALHSLQAGYNPGADGALIGALAHGFVEQEFVGPGFTILSIAVSPDGRFLLAGYGDGAVRLWEIATGREVRQLSGHTIGAKSVAFSPDGHLVLTGSEDKTVRLWETASGREVRQLTGHTAVVRAVAFSPDGQQIVSAGHDRTVRLWETATGKELLTFRSESSGVHSLAFAPNGRTLLTGGQGQVAELWDMSNGRKLRTFLGHTGAIEAVAFSPDGKQVLTGSGDGTARLWDSRSGVVRQVLAGHTASIWAVAFAPDGQTVLTGSADATMRLWDAATGRPLRQFAGHDGLVLAVTFTPDSSHVLSGGQDAIVRLWKAERPSEPLVFAGHTQDVSAVAISPDGRYILTGASGNGKDRTARLWDAHTGTELRQFVLHQDTIINVAFAADSRHILTTSLDKTARLWDATTGQALHKLAGHSKDVYGALSPDGKTVVTGGLDMTLRFWDAQSGKMTSQIAAPDPIVAVAFSSDGSNVMTGSPNGTLRLWNVRAGEEVRHFSAHTVGVTSIAFSPDGRLVLEGNLDQTARLWETATGREVRTFAGHGGAVWSVAFSPDGQYVLTGSTDRTARLWETASGREVRQFVGHSAGVSSVAFARDGQHVLTGSTDHTARLWRVDYHDVITLVCAELPGDLTVEERRLYNITGNSPSCPTP